VFTDYIYKILQRSKGGEKLRTKIRNIAVTRKYNRKDEKNYEVKKFQTIIMCDNGIGLITMYGKYGLC
jgi:hypothetical protein